MDKYYIPQTLDEPFKIILWTLDEVLLFALPFGIIFALEGDILIGSVIGATLVYGLKKMKGEQGHYFIFNLLYWHLPNIVTFKATPPSYLRKLIG